MPSKCPGCGQRIDENDKRAVVRGGTAWHDTCAERDEKLLALTKRFVSNFNAVLHGKEER